MTKRKRPQLSALIAKWRTSTITPAEVEELADQVGRIISWRLQRIHQSRFGWHDLHQECWLNCVRWLNHGAAVEKTVSPVIVGIIDGTVKREHQAATLNTWDCTLEVGKRLGSIREAHEPHAEPVEADHQ